MRIAGLMLFVAACGPPTEPAPVIERDGIPLRFNWPDGATAEIVHTWDQVTDGVVIEEDWNAVVWTATEASTGIHLDAAPADADLPTTPTADGVRAARTELLTAGVARIDEEGHWVGLDNPQVAWEAVQPSIAALGDHLDSSLESADDFLAWRASDWERFFIADLAGLGVEVGQAIELSPRMVDGYDRPATRELVVADFAPCPTEPDIMCVELEFYEEIDRANNTGATLLHRLWVEPATLQPHRLTISRVDFDFFTGSNEVAGSTRSYEQVDLDWTR